MFCHVRMKNVVFGDFSCVRSLLVSSSFFLINSFALLKRINCSAVFAKDAMYLENLLDEIMKKIYHPANSAYFKCFNVNE